MMITVALAHQEQPFIPVRKCTTQFKCQKKEYTEKYWTLSSALDGCRSLYFTSRHRKYFTSSPIVSYPFAELIWCIHISRQLNAHQTNAFVHTYQLCLRSIKDADFRQMCKTFKSMFVSMLCVYEFSTRKSETEYSSILEQFSNKTFHMHFCWKKKYCTEK